MTDSVQNFIDLENSTWRRALPRLNPSGGPAVGETVGPSFGDRGLVPARLYQSRVAPVIGGVEQAPANVAKAMTRPTPASCANPGSRQ